MHYTAFACRMVVSIVFTASAFAKARRASAFREFSASLRTMAAALPGIHRRPVRHGIAGAVVVAEIAVAVAVVLPPTARWALGAAAALLAVFAGVLVLARRNGVTTPCRCFGMSSTTPPGVAQVLRNLVLMAIALGGATAGSVAAMHPAGVGLAAGAATVVALLAISADDIASVLIPSRSRP